jgi:ribosomal protein L17
MADIQTMAKRLAELERVREKLNATGHPDDVASYRSLALKYLAGTSDEEVIVSLITSGMDEMIRAAKVQLREALT